jgi:hypothetical protein
MPSYSWSDPVVLAFIVIPVLLVIQLLAAVSTASRQLDEPESIRRIAMNGTAAVAAIWMAATWALAASGVLLRSDATPPPFALLVLAIVGLAVTIAFTPYGTRLVLGLPIWALVAMQAFRLPLELAMHGMYDRGIMPEQMSYSGRNFDILTGASAIAVAWLLATGRAGWRTAFAWNVAGLALLLNIVGIAILSTPRFAFFGPDRLNVWVMHPPFVWLPAVMVLAALAGHLLIFRALSDGPHPSRRAPQ